MVWDFTTRDTLAQSNVAGTSVEVGKAAKQAEISKLNTYQELTLNYNVIPVVTETHGSWGPIGLKLIKDIGSRIADGERKSKYFLFQAISMAIQREKCFKYFWDGP